MSKNLRGHYFFLPFQIFIKSNPLLSVCCVHITFLDYMFFHILPHTSPDSAEAVAGMFLTMAGITLCVISSMDDGRNGEVTQAGH